MALVAHAMNMLVTIFPWLIGFITERYYRWILQKIRLRQQIIDALEHKILNLIL